MKILAVSDEENERLYTLAQQGAFSEVKFIVGCGDLPYSLLEYLVTLCNLPLVYVPGNHDPAYHPGDPRTYAEGCLHLDGRTTQLHGLLLAGLGGSIRYREGVNQYTQTEMFGRALRLLPRLWLNRLRYGRWLDLLITHAPPFGIHDDPGSAHEGFRAFNWLLRLTRAPYHLHGHTHFQRQNLSPNRTRYGLTEVINVFPYRLLEVSRPPFVP